jgi:hypothetical protein
VVSVGIPQEQLSDTPPVALQEQLLARLVELPALATDAIGKGWAVAHLLAGIRLTPGMVLVYGPRDMAELDVVTAIAATSRAWAAGQA